MKSSLVIVLSLLISGCATYYPPVSVEHFGEADPSKDQKITQVTGEAVAPSDELDRKRDLIDSLKKAAKAMGANAIAVSGAETTNITYVRNGAPVSASSINMTGMTGFAIVEK